MRSRSICSFLFFALLSPSSLFSQTPLKERGFLDSLLVTGRQFLETERPDSARAAFQIVSVEALETAVGAIRHCPGRYDEGRLELRCKSVR